MPIEIDKLTEAELIDLHNRIATRLNFLRDMRAHARMLDFSIGERVMFHPDGYGVLTGVIAKYNRKSVTILTEAGQRWNVSPSLLKRIERTVHNPPPKPAPKASTLKLPKP